MTWTYDASDRTAITQLRESIADITEVAPLLEDEQLDELLTEFGDDVRQAAMAAIERLILPKLALETDRSIQGNSTTRTQRFRQFMDLLKLLKTSQGNRAEIEVGGTSIAADDELRDDTDWNPTIDIGWMDRNPKGAP